MSKHTPGPWKHDTLTEIGGQKTTCIYADTPDSPGGKTIIIRTGRVRGGETEAANIRLATAAPELLHARLDRGVHAMIMAKVIIKSRT